MIRKLGFFLLSLLGKKTDGTRQTGGLDDASTDFVQHRFLWPERGKLEYFLLFQLEGERRRLRQRRHLPENKRKIKEKERERKRDSGQNQQCWVDKSLVLAVFHYHSSNVPFFVLKFLNLLQLSFYCMKAGIIHTDIAPEFTVAVAIKDENLTLTIFSNQLTCK